MSARRKPEPKPIAEISASPPRRFIAVGVVAALGGLLLALALFHPPQSVAARLFLLLIGLGTLALAEKLRRATLLHLLLTPEGLSDSAGQVLARFEDIRSVDRGAFAFKPANGFALRLERRHPVAWVPGMWWRFGPWLGVGGVIAKSEGRGMADAISHMLAERKLREPSER